MVPPRLITPTRRGGCIGLTLLALTGCVHPDPVPEVVPAAVPEAVAQDLYHLRAEVDQLRKDLGWMGNRLDILEPITTRVAKLEQRLTPPRKGKAPPALQSVPSAQLVVAAQKEARVYPTERQFWGKSGDAAYVWEPGKVFIIYLTWNHQTAISLPVGERAVTGLRLSQDQYDVETKTVGTDDHAYDIISVRPLFEKGETPAFVACESGRRFLFHFLVGDKGMQSVTFESTPIRQDREREPKLVLPRPPS